MRLFALLLACLIGGCGGCASVQPLDVARDAYVALRFEGATCSGTAIGPDTFITADHCFDGGDLLTVNGNMVAVVSILRDGNDHAKVTVAGAKFTTWAKWAKRPMVQGDAVTWIGGPAGETHVLRRGYVAKVSTEGVLIDAQIWKGDSGAGVLNDRGELVGMVSAMTGPAPSFVMAVLLPFGVFKASTESAGG